MKTKFQQSRDITKRIFRADTEELAERELKLYNSFDNGNKHALYITVSGKTITIYKDSNNVNGSHRNLISFGNDKLIRFNKDRAELLQNVLDKTAEVYTLLFHK